MKNLFGLLITCLLLSTAVYAQESREADAERVRNAREVNARNAERRAAGSATVEIYTKVDLIFADDKMSIQSSKSEGKIGDTYSSRSYPEIERLAKMELGPDAEIDFLNFMGENDWKLITVHVNTKEKTTTKSMYFSKSMPAIKTRSASRSESAPNPRSTPAQRTAPAQR